MCRRWLRRRELLLPFDDLEKEVLALAKAIPEEKYAWRPGPGVRSFKEVLLHIVYGNQLLLNVAGNSPSRDEVMKQIERNAKGEQDAVSKEKIGGMLAESFASVRKAMQGVRTTSALTRDVDFFGTSGAPGRRARHYRYAYRRTPGSVDRVRTGERHRAAVVAIREVEYARVPLMPTAVRHPPLESGRSDKIRDRPPAEAQPRQFHPADRDA